MILINKKWNELISSDKSYYESHGFIEVNYDSDTNTVSLKKRDKGRPSIDESRNKNITVRMTDLELSLLDNYCNTSNLKRSEVIRLAVNKLLTD